MPDTQNTEFKLEDEEAGVGRAAPGLDLVAAGFLIALAILVMVASIRLPVPGGLHTAPGMLPFLVAASLAVMAIALGASALGRRGLRPRECAAGVLGRPEDRRTAALALTVALYIWALHVFAFEAFVRVAGIPFLLTAFEPVTVVALAAIMRMSWRGPLWAVALISAGWTMALSLAFQKLFSIPLPGGF